MSTPCETKCGDVVVQTTTPVKSSSPKLFVTPWAKINGTFGPWPLGWKIPACYLPDSLANTPDLNVTVADFLPATGTLVIQDQDGSQFNVNLLAILAKLVKVGGGVFDYTTDQIATAADLTATRNAWQASLAGQHTNFLGSGTSQNVGYTVITTSFTGAGPYDLQAVVTALPWTNKTVVDVEAYVNGVYFPLRLTVPNNSAASANYWTSANLAAVAWQNALPGPTAASEVTFRVHVRGF